MAISPTLPAVLGAAAFFPTSAALAMQIILARSPADHAASVRSAASVSAFFEAVLFVTIPLISLSYASRWAPNFEQTMWLRYLWLAGGFVVCIAATIAGIAAVACLGRVDDDPQSTIVDNRAGDLVTGSAIVLALAAATQLLFFISHLIAGRAPAAPQEPARPSMEAKLGSRIKTVPYQKTSPLLKEYGSKSFDSSRPPGSSSSRSGSETLVSLRSSISHAIRPTSSKSRLISHSRMSSQYASSSVIDLSMPPEARTPPSRAGDEEQGFDSWDTSAVAPETRQTVMEQSSSPAASPAQARVSRFLETIPASRSPSPAEAVAAAAVAAAEAASAAAKAAAAVAAVMAEESSCPLEPPPRSAARRSRSYSHISTRVIEAQRAAFNPPMASPTESNIHPLFRSDSPLPPPSATPGTVVVAAPNAGQVIPGQSVRTMRSVRRLRSESLPPQPSPLSRAQSCESFLQHRHQKMLERRAESLLLSPQIREEDEGVVGTPGQGQDPAERKMTPPIPEWILAAGQRTSLTAYQRRRSSQSSWQSQLQRQQEAKRAEGKPAATSSTPLSPSSPSSSS
ncbi:hypothetical protein VTJ83DRAFT_2497 [Remersonia thermophila]|uniref:Uncharacterized protein n=1 Tax=Remersonia thermophila TaxID=72144 RepID=A0ABR4DIX1_9PEZI